MSDEEKKAIETIQNYNNKKAVDLSLYFLDVSNASKTILNLIEKQNKIIDLMAEQIDKLNDELNKDCFVPREYSDINSCIRKESCKQCIKEYFTYLVEK